MPNKIKLDEKAIIEEYQKGESGVVLAKRLGVSTFMVYELLKKCNIKKHGSLGGEHHSTYKHIKTESSDPLAYVIGFTLGDGCVTKYIDKRGYTIYRVQAQQPTEILIRKYEHALREIGLNPSVWNRDKPCIVLGVKSRLRWKLICNSMAFGKWWGNLALQSIELLLQTDSQKLNFIEGFFDAEGSARVYNPLRKGKYRNLEYTVSFFNNNKDLLVFTQTLLKHFNLDFYIRITKDLTERKNICYELTSGKKSAFVFFSERVFGEDNPKVHNHIV